MKRNTLIIATLATVVGLGALGATATLAGPGGFGPGYGPGYGMMQNGQGMGPGMMQGRGHGHGFMQSKGYGPQNCPNNQAQALATPLTIDDVRANLEQRLQWRGNDRLKVGTVVDKDDTTITAEIVTVDDSLVRKVEIDKTTGRHTPVQ